MDKPIEFNSFYKLLYNTKSGRKDSIEILSKVASDYKEGKESQNEFDELGKIYCYIGLCRIYEYTGIKDISYIHNISEEIWNYIEVREEVDLSTYIKRGMKEYSNKNVIKDIALKWNVKQENLENNIEGLANYITEGIVETIKDKRL
tara:strand:- start:126 stop:566 length:441 start_codon:yes stop_codon:yes gene_type:complete